MSVLRRKMFKGGGYAHRGTGITSGLVPVQRFDNGGEVRDRYKEYLKIMEDIKTPSKPFSRLAAASPALLNLSGALLSGKSYQGGVGGALDILGQGLSSSAPLFGEAVKARRAHAQQEVAAEDAMKMQALTMAYDEIAASKKATQDYQPKDYMVTFNDKAGAELKDTDGMVTRIFNKKTSEYDYQLPSGETISGDAFKIISDKIEPADASTSQDYSTEYFKVKVGDTTKTLTKVSNKTTEEPGKWYYANGEEVPASVTDTMAILGKVGTATEGAKQNFTTEDFKVKIGEETKTLTKVTDKTTTEPGIWYDSGGKKVSAEDIDNMTILGKLGTAEAAAKPKKRTPTTDVAYVFNKGWESGDSMDKKYTQIQTKIDEDNNITLYDDKSKTYVSEEDFREQYGNFTLDQPMDFVAADIAKEEAIDSRESAFRFRFKQLGGTGDLSEDEMNYLLTSLPEDYIKTLQTGTVSELDDLLYEMIKNKQAKKEETLEKAKEPTSTVETEEGPKEVTKDAIDLYYNLDPASPNYASRRAYFVQKYNQTPVISENEADEIHNAIANLKDLNTIWDNVEEAIPLIGKPAAFFAETFGVNLGLVEFMTGVRGLEASAIDQLVKGIPSDFDARRVIAMIPKAGIAPETNKIRIKRLRDVFGDLILNKIKFAIETGKRVPASLVMTAMEIGDPAEITEALRGEPNQEKMDYLNNIGAGIEGFSKEGYIKKFGDPFRRSLSLLDVADEDYDGPMSKEDEERLDDLRKKYLPR